MCEEIHDEEDPKASVSRLDTEMISCMWIHDQVDSHPPSQVHADTKFLQVVELKELVVELVNQYSGTITFKPVNTS